MKIGMAEGAALLLILVLVAVLVYPLFPKRDRMDAVELTRLTMKRTAVRILKFYADKNSWPDTASWEQALRPYLAGDKTFPPDDFLKAAWGNQIRYRVQTNNAQVIRFLQSFGPNHVDDHGSNDDIVFEISASLN